MTSAITQAWEDAMQSNLARKHQTRVRMISIRLDYDSSLLLVLKFADITLSDWRYLYQGRGVDHYPYSQMVYKKGLY